MYKYMTIVMWNNAVEISRTTMTPEQVAETPNKQTMLQVESFDFAREQWVPCLFGYRSVMTIQFMPNDEDINNVLDEMRRHVRIMRDAATERQKRPEPTKH